MRFDTARFEAAQLQPRTSDVPVPGLAAFFAEGVEPVWRVRGLTAIELHESTDAGKRRHTVDNIIKAISEGGDQIKGLREAIGMPAAIVPAEVVKRQEMLRFGSIDPVIDLTVAVKLSESFPVEFLQLTNEITLLTGQGADLVKPAAASPLTTPSQPA